MHLLANLLGRLIFCLGVMTTVVGCVIGSVLGSSVGTTLPGAALICLGAVIYWRTVTKPCTQCLNRIKSSARQCHHCGSAQS